ncbi:MAG: MBL fold metallo-hydrolase [Planctomycetota bacterium]|nr:MBL fold metallo-hydrolase [Planctomycetota bacterium]
MEVISLQSGSNGNSFYVRAGKQQFLFDAGITGALAEKRLASHGKDIREIDGLFISHGHRDHCQSMGVYHRKYGHPIFLNEQTLFQARRDHKIGILNDLHFFKSGETINLGQVQVHTISTPHDALDSVAFVIEYNQKQLGILTDIGHVNKTIAQTLCQLDAVIIESNYDAKMLSQSHYPLWLKQRVRGKGGHLSNKDSALALREALAAQKSNALKEDNPPRLQWICLCHLSRENNQPAIALQTHREILGNSLPLHIASRDDVGEKLILDCEPVFSEEKIQAVSPAREQQKSLF